MHGNSVVHRRLSYTKTRAKVRNFPHIRSNESENSSIFKANRHKFVLFIPDIWLYRQICILLQISLRERAAPRQLERALLHSACTVLAASKRIKR